MMNIRRTAAAAAFALCACGGAALAAEPAGASKAFADLYVGTCMQNLNNLDALRARLLTNKLPKFPPTQAAHFLMGLEGDAWPVPAQGQTGNFVLTLPAQKNACTVLARRADQAEVERLFIALVAKAPAPLVAERKPDVAPAPGPDGEKHTIAYTWSVPGAARKMLFVLTTASSDSAPMQAVATAAMTSD